MLVGVEGLMVGIDRRHRIRGEFWFLFFSGGRRGRRGKRLGLIRMYGAGLLRQWEKKREGLKMYSARTRHPEHSRWEIELWI